MAMEARRLGPAGPAVSVLSLGCWMLGWQVGAAESVAIARRAFELGITCFDTADTYGHGSSEKVLGAALGRHRDDVTIATKVYGPVGRELPGRGLAPGRVKAACEGSLRRLGTDHIDLYQLHRPDPTVPIQETVGALAELVRAGKVGAIGTSTFRSEQLGQAQSAAVAVGTAPFAAEQPPYSLLERAVERTVVDVCRRWEMAILPWSPLAGGLLTGKYGLGQPPPPQSRLARWGADMTRLQPALERVERLDALAREAGMPLGHLALSWLRDRPGVASVLVGPRTAAQLDDYVASLGCALDRGLWDRIDAVVPPGHTWLHSYDE
jgi:aryl-alcohol dehydrogenase (NADP+)